MECEATHSSPSSAGVQVKRTVNQLSQIPL